MGHRLSKIYTRTGDKGTTGLGDGSRVSKSSLRIRCMGTMDELNAHIGVVLSYQYEIDEPVTLVLTRVQHHLFDLGGELCLPGQERIPQAYVDELENELDKLNENLQPLKEFILPGGCKSSAFCHLARTVCRRAETELIELSEMEQVNPISLSYINRLSDLLFVMSRHINKNNSMDDVLWRPGLK